MWQSHCDSTKRPPQKGLTENNEITAQCCLAFLLKGRHFKLQKNLQLIIEYLLLIRAFCAFLSFKPRSKIAYRPKYDNLTHSILLGHFCRGGHSRYFLNFPVIKNDFCIFYQVINLFLLQSYLKSTLPVKLTW